MKKKCFKCRKRKNLGEFYKHSQMADGYMGKCKECVKKDVTKNRNENVERYREYDRKRGKLPHRKQKVVKYSKKYKKLYPLRYAANTILRNAIRSKKMKSPKECSMCGDTKRKIMGHHEDYYKPLEVIWVCQVCHKELHRTAGVRKAVKDYQDGKNTRHYGRG